VQDLHYVYNQGTPLATRALEGISFVLGSGKTLGVVGGTGSGKTTLIRHLNGLLVPSRGRVLISGVETRTYGPELAHKVGVVFQRPERQLFEETVFSDISFALRRFSRLSEEEILSRVRRACDQVGLPLDDIGERSPQALSDGEKRKVAIAAVLVNRPEVLVLDEPSAGLDPSSVAGLIRMLQGIKESGNRTIVIVAHDIEEFLPLVDQILVLDRGRMAAFGTPSEICGALRNDPRIAGLLPGVALVVHDLRSAGYDLNPNGYKVDSLAEQIAVLAKLPESSKCES